MTTAPAVDPQLQARKRGARTLALAIALLVIALLLLGGFEPAVGARYPLVIRLAVYALSGAGWIALLQGLHRVIVGPGTGALAAPLRLIAIAVVVGGIAVGAVAAWAIHAIASEPRRAATGHHHDWD